MEHNRRDSDREIGMIIAKIDILEKKIDLFAADFKHQCELKHLSLEEYIRKSSDKMPIMSCNDRMMITEKVLNRHTNYWGTFIALGSLFLLGISWWFVEFIKLIRK